MRPDQEHAARNLASVVLDGFGRVEPLPGLREAVAPTLRLEIQGLVRGMSRQVMVDSAELARLMTEEWERQASEINVADLVRQEVRRQLDVWRIGISNHVAQRLKEQINRAIDERIGNFAEETAKRATDRLVAAAMETIR